VELRDPEANYNKTDRAALAQLTPNFDWGKYLSDVGISDVDSLNVGQPEFFQALDKQIGETPIDDWKTYLRWQLINSTASQLSSKFVDENFHFKGTVLSGTPVNRPRWKRVVAASNEAIGELVGQAYVEKTFPPEAKQRVKTMVDNLKAALRDDLQTLSWMSPETRQKAIDKMDAFTEKIGYPDVWKDYSGLDIDRGPFVQNMMRASQFAFRQDLAKIGKPVDRTEWHMTPQTVNAYYNPLMNEIVFPAGILQPPFFDPKADDAVNYGAIGAVIGHEMTHGFDDQGAQFDGKGNLRNWWTDADLEHFHQRTDAIANLFSSYEVEPGLHVNGKLVTGEATADLGGLALAYRAYKRSLEGQPQPPVLDGFTADQRFFLGFAQVWAGAQRPEWDRMQVATDPHPPAIFRVNGTLGNTPAFYDAWGVKQNDPMAIPADQQTQIW
jgi:putative endopeptidase